MTTVICIHGSTCTSRQWLPLMERLSDRYQVFAPDLYGYGNSPTWQRSREMKVDDEVDLLTPVFDSVTNELILIGHSWGGAVALKAALKYQGKLKLLVLFEPALWSVLISETPESAAAHEIIQMRDKTMRFVKRGNLLEAAEHFVCYWAGSDTWSRLNESQRLSLADNMQSVRNDWLASFSDTASLSDLAQIDIPVLLMTGTRSPLPGKALVKLIGETLPQTRTVDLSGCGHMAPVSHSEQVNDAIEEFILDYCI
ncbi:MAG: alpha/beta hydrolase [Gammaproteobacteria bacterium]|nr:alpha/beta hydrolase [Gammaproteobacteria bacterium]